MDKKFIKILKSTSGSVFAEVAVGKTFNGWFLMKTPQVSTRGVSLLSNSNSRKKHPCCGKVAVQFFSLQAGYPVCGFCFELIPSKYMFMKNTLMNTRSGNLRFHFVQYSKRHYAQTLLT
jgi:hypothetical protein